MRNAFLFTAVLGLLPANLCLAQFFTPVSTILDAKTWGGINDNVGTYATSPAQGPDDYEDLGSQTGMHQASSQLTYMSTSTTADGSVSINLAAGTISVTLNATSDSGAPFPTQGLASTTIIFDVPPGFGLQIGLNTTQDGIYNDSSSSLTGPDGLSWQDVSSEDIPFVPAGQYILTCMASTQEIAGTERQFPGQNLTAITIFPEPSGCILAAGILCLIPTCRRRV